MERGNVTLIICIPLFESSHSLPSFYVEYTIFIQKKIGKFGEFHEMNEISFTRID